MSQNNLRKLRAEHSLSLSDVAAVSGVSVAMLSRLENGQRELSGLKKIALARSLGVPVEDIFPRESIPA